MARGMTLEEIGELVKQVSYPNVEFSVATRLFEGGVIIRLDATIPDINDPEKMVKGVYWSHPIPDELTLEPELFKIIFPQAIWQVVSDYEAHERMEQLRVGGVPIYDPHPPTPDGRGATWPDINRPYFPPLTDRT